MPKISTAKSKMKTKVRLMKVIRPLVNIFLSPPANTLNQTGFLRTGLTKLSGAVQVSFLVRNGSGGQRRTAVLAAGLITVGFGGTLIFLTGWLTGFLIIFLTTDGLELIGFLTITGGLDGTALFTTIGTKDF